MLPPGSNLPPPHLSSPSWLPALLCPSQRSMMTGIFVNVHDESLSPDLGLLKDTSTLIVF